jgi:hypothetical protein
MDLEGGVEASSEPPARAAHRRLRTPVTARPALVLAFALTPVLTLVSVDATRAGVASPSVAAATRVIDRAFLCTNSRSRTGVREIRVGATSGFREAEGWKWLASAGIANEGMTPTKLGSDENGLTVYTHWGFGFSAGAGPLANDPTLPQPKRFFYIWAKWAKACKPAAKRRVPLSARGLSGGVAEDETDPDADADQFECAAPQSVLVRLRGVFHRPTSLRLDRASRQLTTAEPVREASFAARTVSGKPLVFASASKSGKARIFTAPTCVTD